jgi:histidinol-phosphate/aromatic aminotransferase/cobyric acid decarboxylase-like protein
MLFDAPKRGPGLRAHGGPIAEELARLGLTRGDLVDFSVNVNPHGPTPAMLEAIRAARVDLYPDSTSFEARVALATAAGIGADCVVVGDGAASLLWALARLLVGPGRAALMVEPTFSEFRAAAEAAGGGIVEWRATSAHDFDVDLEAIAARARTGGASALYLCTPNNPTGTMVRAAEVVALAEALPGVTLVVDQAFLSLSEHHADAGVEMPPNVVRVRSLTKEHAIPGVRAGYLIATPAIAAAVEAARPAWSTSAAAQAAAVASVGLVGFVSESRGRLLADRRALVAGLREVDLAGRPLAPRPTCATFCIVEVGDAERLRAALLARHRILIRDCASFGLPRYARLAARPAADRQRLLVALREELGGC